MGNITDFDKKEPYLLLAFTAQKPQMREVKIDERIATQQAMPYILQPVPKNNFLLTKYSFIYT